MGKIIREHTIKYLNVLDQWTKGLDEGRSVDCIYMDFQKCFDTVPHRIVLHKLQGYGMNNQIIQWIIDFLIGRKQRVQCTFSEWMLVFSGIPQGSVLGLLVQLKIPTLAYRRIRGDI